MEIGFDKLISMTEQISKLYTILKEYNIKAISNKLNCQVSAQELSNLKSQVEELSLTKSEFK